ncbi:MAG: type II and III secretion system protein family protein [Betaproteobacteria bacterium]
MPPLSRPTALRGAVLGVCLALQAEAYAAPASQGTATALCASVRMAPLVEVPVGKSSVLRMPAPATRILLGNPENARAARPADMPERRKDEGVKAPPTDNRPGVAEVDVLLLAPTEVVLLGKTIGSTNVVMLDDTGTCTAFDVVVGMDTRGLESVLARLLPGEKDIKVTPAFDSLVLSGAVSDSEAMARVGELAQAYVRSQDGGGGGSARSQRVINMLEVDSPQQVMLEVKVAEVSKALIDKLGVQFSGSRTNGNWTYNLLADFLSGGAGLASVAKATGSLGVAVDAQKDDALVKVLAEPTVMAISGQTGSFLAGGKIFIPVAQDNGTAGGRSVTLEEKEFGVSVKFTPTVLGNGRINLRVRPEVSELNREGIGIVASGVNGTAILPSFTSRRAETTVQLMDGQSFAIGGLIKNNTKASIKAFPFLGELPVIGALFRSTDFQTDRSELVFVITPRLVKPLPTGYRLPTDGYTPPSRSDLMLDGRLERRGRDDPPTPTPPGKPTTPLAAEGGFEKEKL